VLDTVVNWCLLKNGGALNETVCGFVYGRITPGRGRFIAITYGTILIKLASALE
jgi:hypothetical protein